VLAGDAAHTAHFTIGSGTKLAMEDAIALSAALDIHGDDLERALTDYELERQPIVERFQEAARDSATYFESVGRYASFDPMQFAFNLLTRSGRIGHLELEKRDAAFVARVDRGFQERSSAGLPRDRFGPEVLRLLTAGDLPTTPPALEPLALGSTVLWNRLAIQAPDGDDAVDGIIGERHAIRMGTSARSGAGLVLTDLVAVSQEGRICRGTPGIWTDEQAESFSPIERLSEGGPPIAMMLTHAGRRGSMRPRREGADRPLRSNGWEAVAPSAVPLSPSHPAPREATPAYLEVLAEAFGQAARRARDIGFPILLLDMAHGHLLASFLSPLANRRTDAYGGSLEGRMRFPMEVFERARAEWPTDRPLGVRLQATDWARGGFDAEDAVAVARALRERGCDLIEVAAGQAVPGGQPDYRRLFLVPFADRIRNDAGVVTMVGGNVATRDDVNTILAAGRADLCLVDPRLYASGRVSSAT
jgi:anthraniloyl-CoA monooxygenase